MEQLYFACGTRPHIAGAPLRWHRPSALFFARGWPRARRRHNQGWTLFWADGIRTPCFRSPWVMFPHPIYMKNIPVQSRCRQLCRMAGVCAEGQCRGHTTVAECVKTSRANGLRPIRSRRDRAKIAQAFMPGDRIPYPCQSLRDGRAVEPIRAIGSSPGRRPSRGQALGKAPSFGQGPVRGD